MAYLHNSPLSIHTLLSILSVLSIFVNDRKFVELNVHIEGVLMSKSCNTALMNFAWQESDFQQ